MRQAELRASYNVEFEVQRREFLNTMSLRHRSQETEEGTHWWDGVPQRRIRESRGVGHVPRAGLWGSGARHQAGHLRSLARKRVVWGQPKRRG